MQHTNPLLLPSGLYDLLPAEARKEAWAMRELLGGFERFGYEHVSPPLMEFDTSLLAGRSDTLKAQTFWVMDSMSQATMGLRADITPQIARIARSRLVSVPRPLRLCYAGRILRMKPEPLHNERQLTQAGIELIGSDGVQADAEVIIVSAQSLASMGIRDISVDINLPGLLGELCPEARENPELRSSLRDAIALKDVAMIASLPLASKKLLIALIQAAGPINKALAALAKLKLQQMAKLQEVAACIKHACPTLVLTLDPLEYSGFEYHEGISFSLFARGLRHELGRGGRYKVGDESATGLTLYITHLLPLLKAPPAMQRVLVPSDTTPAMLARLHKQGLATIYAHSAVNAKEAKLLNCSHMVVGTKLVDLLS